MNDKERMVSLDDEKKEILRRALESAEITEGELEEVAGGMLGCDSCSSSCQPGCSPGHVGSVA